MTTTDRFRRYGHLLRPSGTNQAQRLLPALEAGYIAPDERSLSQLVDYARRVAAEIRFYESGGQSLGDWRPFLESLLDPATGATLPTPDLAAMLDRRDDWPPHLVLFLAFLTLFEHLQADLNRLPESHLRHYYEQHLGLHRRGAARDDVHVVFELARNAAATLLVPGTRLDGGKDAAGRALIYATQGEIVVSAAAVGGMRRLVIERDRGRNRRVFVAGAFTELEGRSGFTFGRRQLDLDPSQRFMTEAALGFAVAAPILELAEGDRTIRLVARLQRPASAPPVVSQGVGYALDVALTGEEGWLVPDRVEADLVAPVGSAPPMLSLTLTLGAASGAVVEFDAAVHGAGPPIGRPVLRCLIKGETGVYELLDGLVVDKVDLSVEVTGVKDLVVQNADGPLSVDAPMPLFGSQPQIGTPFYIGSAEVFGKRLTSLDLRLEWKGIPKDLFDHYRGYFDTTDTFLSDNFHIFFQADLDLLYDRSFRRLTVNRLLFAPLTTDPQTISVDQSLIDAAFPAGDYVERPDLEQPDAFTSSSRFGFARLVLSKPVRGDFATYTSAPFEAFGHRAFAPRYANQAIELSKWTTGPKPLLPNEPYTPELSGLTLDYRAKADVIPADRRGTGFFLTAGPFGLAPAADLAAARLVPSIDGEAALLLGIEQFEPPGNLSLFFQIEAGTATSPAVLETGDTDWSYLAAGDVWRALDLSAVLVDSTEGFQTPGLIAISVPRDAAVNHSSLPSGLVWLRARIQRPPESAARTIAIRTNAALARFDPVPLAVEHFQEHLAAGLPAGRITRLLKPNASVKKVEQPNPSFGGRGEEGNVDHFRRISERLRHRNRAVTAWDLERLVLEAFPEVFKVKCLPHTDGAAALKPGHAALVIVPNVRRTGASNVLEPRAGAVLMGRIQEYLAGLKSPFSTLHVMHPAFERMRVEARVTFQPGRDPGYYARALNDDLRRFLSPWAYQEGEDILFGGRIYRSEILAFIEGREYVDHLTDLQLYHSFEGPARGGIGSMTIGVDFFVRANPRPGLDEMRIGDTFIVGRGVEIAETTQAHAILVSHPEHLITPVPRGGDVCPGIARLGVGYMTVGLDFTVHPELTA